MCEYITLVDRDNWIKSFAYIYKTECIHRTPNITESHLLFIHRAFILYGRVHWNNMAIILRTTFANAFCWIKILIHFDLSTFQRVQLTISQYWVIFGSAISLLPSMFTWTDDDQVLRPYLTLLGHNEWKHAFHIQSRFELYLHTGALHRNRFDNKTVYLHSTSYVGMDQ